MATNPYFVISPSAVLSIIGLLHGPDKTIPTPPEDWRKATVNVVIPTLNEENNIVLCLASLAKQTFKPERIIHIDDGSSDKTRQYVKSFSKANDIPIISIKRQKPIGKTPSIKRQAREFEADVEFILDGDTILESENYIERTVEELYKAVGIACACGTVLPLRDKDREKLFHCTPISKFKNLETDVYFFPQVRTTNRFMRWLSNIYRDVLYTFLQKFVYHGQMVFFGSIINPVGCAVAYRQKYIKELFDHYEPILGDDLSNSEDIFIGFALLNQGYRNIQLMDVYARSQEPEAEFLPRQIYMWSSAFLQSCYYFKYLVRSPFLALKRWRYIRKTKKTIADEEIKKKRKIQEPYRQAFGEEITKKFGRKMGWVIFWALAEKIFFPLAIIVMALLRLWEPLIVTFVAETILSLSILVYISKGSRFKYLIKGLIATPVRYLSLLFDIYTISRFASDIWLTKDKRWRK